MITSIRSLKGPSSATRIPACLLSFDLAFVLEAVEKLRRCPAILRRNVRREFYNSKHFECFVLMLTTILVTFLEGQSCKSYMANSTILSPLDQWLEHEGVESWGALEQHSQVLKKLIHNQTSPQDAAKELVDIASLSSDPSDTAYRFWNLLFYAAASLPAYIDHIVQITLAIRRIPPSPERPNTLSYTLWSHWQDTHSYYYTWRTLRASSSTDNLTGAQRWINFTAFSARLVQHGDEMAMLQIGINGFFDIRDALETTLETRARYLPKNAIVTPEQSLENDTVAAAQWVIYAGSKLLHLHNDFFGNAWNKGLSKKTDFWDGEPGFSQARWKFWAARLVERTTKDPGSEEAIEAARDAACLIRTHLRESA